MKVLVSLAMIAEFSRDRIWTDLWQAAYFLHHNGGVV